MMCVLDNVVALYQTLDSLKKKRVFIVGLTRDAATRPWGFGVASTRCGAN